MFDTAVKFLSFLFSRAAVASVLLFAGTAIALVPEEQQARLDSDLTPLGSERAGNADGSIPACTGGLINPPEGIGYEKGKHLPESNIDIKQLQREGINHYRTEQIWRFKE